MRVGIRVFNIGHESWLLFPIIFICVICDWFRSINLAMKDVVDALNTSRHTINHPHIWGSRCVNMIPTLESLAGPKQRMWAEQISERIGIKRSERERSDDQDSANCLLFDRCRYVFHSAKLLLHTSFVFSSYTKNIIPRVSFRQNPSDDVLFSFFCLFASFTTIFGEIKFV